MGRKWTKMDENGRKCRKGGFYTFRDRWRALLRELVVNIAPNSANPSSLKMILGTRPFSGTGKATCRVIQYVQGKSNFLKPKTLEKNGPKNGRKWPKVAQNGLKWAKNGRKWAKIIQKMVDNGQKWAKIGRKWTETKPKNGPQMDEHGRKLGDNGQKWEKIDRKWQKIVKNGRNWPKTGEMDRK